MSARARGALYLWFSLMGLVRTGVHRSFGCDAENAYVDATASISHGGALYWLDPGKDGKRRKLEVCRRLRQIWMSGEITHHSTRLTPLYTYFFTTLPTKFAMWQQLVTATEFWLNQPMLLSALVEPTLGRLHCAKALQQGHYMSVHRLVYRAKQRDCLKDRPGKTICTRMGRKLRGKTWLRGRAGERKKCTLRGMRVNSNIGEEGGKQGHEVSEKTSQNEKQKPSMSKGSDDSAIMGTSSAGETAN